MNLFLFLFTGVPGLTDNNAIEHLRDRCQITMSEYVSNEYPNQPTRFGRILLTLGRIQKINTKVIEHVFFRKEIGDIPIETLIRNIFHRS